MHGIQLSQSGMFRISFLQPEQLSLPFFTGGRRIGQQQLKRCMQQRYLKPERRLGQLVAGQSSIQTAAQQRAKFPVFGKLKIILITGMNMKGN
ncbi:hypothetical protein D3C75_1198030 [compost metagenome]